MKNIYTLLIAILISFSIYGQENLLAYKSKMADLGEIQIEYMDFGGKGVPFIWVQDFHNYFEGPYSKFPESPLTIELFARLSSVTRVLAPLRRGYGKSTDTQWGYDVATQAEDLIAFMDALKIEKAIFFGSLPANQDITWIAEHHPERVAGLIYWGNPILVAGCHEPDVMALIENWSAIAGLDFNKDKEKLIVMSRALWRPHFLLDPDFRINIPALRFTSQLDLIYVFRRMVESGRIENLITEEKEGFEQEYSALREIVQDSIRYAKLKKDLIGCDQTIAIDQALVRAFGKNLKTLNEDDQQFDENEYWKSYIDWLHGHISIFINELNN